MVKNSLTEISRWRVAIDSAVARRLGAGVAGSSSGADVSGGSGGGPLALPSFFFFDLGMALGAVSPREGPYGGQNHLVNACQAGRPWADMVSPA